MPDEIKDLERTSLCIALAKYLDSETVKKILTKLELDYDIAVVSDTPVAKEKIVDALKDLFGPGAGGFVEEFLETYNFLKAKN